MKKTLLVLLAIIMIFGTLSVLCSCDTQSEQEDQGEQSTQGEEGVSILKVEIIDGCLWITYSNAPDTPVIVG